MLGGKGEEGGGEAGGGGVCWGRGGGVNGHSASSFRPETSRRVIANQEIHHVSLCFLTPEKTESEKKKQRKEVKKKKLLRTATEKTT